jgi:hypothetical protein
MPGLPPGGTPGAPTSADRHGRATPGGPGAAAPHYDLAAGAAPPSAPPVLGAPRRPDVPTFARAGKPVLDPDAVRASLKPGGTGPSVLRAPRVQPGTPAGPDLPLPGFGRRNDALGRPIYAHTLDPGDWITAPAPDAIAPTAPVIDGSARLARMQPPVPEEPLLPPAASGAAPSVLGNPATRSAPKKRKTKRRAPELAARRLVSTEPPPPVDEDVSAVITDEQAFTVATPGGSVLANEPPRYAAGRAEG